MTTAIALTQLTPSERDRGSGTVLMLGVVGVVAVLAVVLATLVQAQSARGEAQAAADFGALAGAAAQRHGLDSCEIAATAIARNGATLAMCTEESGGVVRVTVRVPVGAALLGATFGDATAEARAGPAGSG